MAEGKHAAFVNVVGGVSVGEGLRLIAKEIFGRLAGN